MNLHFLTLHNAIDSGRGWKEGGYDNTQLSLCMLLGGVCVHVICVWSPPWICGQEAFTNMEVPCHFYLISTSFQGKNDTLNMK